jgi:hypothetical protein
MPQTNDPGRRVTDARDRDGHIDWGPWPIASSARTRRAHRLPETIPVSGVCARCRRQGDGLTDTRAGRCALKRQRTGDPGRARPNTEIAQLHAARACIANKIGHAGAEAKRFSGFHYPADI